MRNDGDLQFAPVAIPEVIPPEPNWFERMLIEVFRFLAELFAPLGQLFGASWWWLQWVLLAVAVGFALLMLVRMFGPGLRRNRQVAEAEAEWQPDRAATIALLEDADRLAAEGRFDEATRLLLQRSVGHIAAARPDWEAARAAYAEFALARLNQRERSA